MCHMYDYYGLCTIHSIRNTNLVTKYAANESDPYTLLHWRTGESPEFEKSLNVLWLPSHECWSHVQTVSAVWKQDRTKVKRGGKVLP